MLKATDMTQENSLNNQNLIQRRKKNKKSRKKLTKNDNLNEKKYNIIFCFVNEKGEKFFSRIFLLLILNKMLLKTHCVCFFVLSSSFSPEREKKTENT